MELELEEETLDISWLQEEESLIHMDSIPQKKPLERIELRMFFVDSQMNMQEIHPCMVELDVSNNGSLSILSKECILKHIEKAKREYTDIYASSGSFTLLDILIWNITVGAEHIQSFVEASASSSSYGDTVGFAHGSLFSDIVLEPSLSIFHSEQCVFIFLRESRSTNSSNHNNKSNPKQTKRVRFQSNAYKHTRKVVA
jgi:hypothetical protein